MRSEFKDRPDLLAQVVPNYPVGAKRVVLDNGIWAKTLKRPDVELVSTGIDRIEPRGVRGADGRLHEAEVIVYGTGLPRLGVPHAHAGDRPGRRRPARSLGRRRPRLQRRVRSRLPQPVLRLRPQHTNIVINGSIIYFSECAVNYAVECLRFLSERGAAAMDCRREAYDRYAALMDEHNAQMAWGISSVNSWYKNPKGRVTQNWPLPLIDYWRQTRTPNPADFELL